MLILKQLFPFFMGNQPFYSPIHCSETESAGQIFSQIFLTGIIFVAQ